MSSGSPRGSLQPSSTSSADPDGLVDHLVGRIRDRQRADAVMARLEQWRALEEDERARNLPGIYLVLEHYLEHVEGQGVETVREQARTRFAPLLDDSRFGLIFASEDRQEVLLCREFLRPILERALVLLGENAHPSLRAVARWLEGAGDLTGPSVVPEPLSVPDRDGWGALLGRLGQDLYERLVEHLGEAVARDLFETSYTELAEEYLGLGAFAAVVRLFPPEILDERQLSILSRGQTRRVLMEKLDELQAMNTQLLDKNADLEMALSVLERSHDELEHRVEERTVELRAAAERFAESEERLRRISEAARDGIVMVDGRGRVVYTNAAAERLLGYERAELLGESLLSKAVPERYRRRFAETFRAALSTGQGPGVGQTAEFVARRSDDTEVPVELSLASARYRGSWHLVGVVRDITQRKRLEEERERLAERLQESQRLESLGAVAGGIAHDFNNLLTAIVGHVGLIEASSDAGFPFHENLEQIQEAAQRATDLTRQMLAYSGRGHFVKEPVDLGALASEMTELLRSSVSKRARLVLEAAADLPKVAADRSQMRQVLVHLVTNASEALGETDGDVRLRLFPVAMTRRRLDAARQGREACEGPYVALEVSDTGHGMGEETVAKMFDPFFTTRFTGRGLGLAAVSGIVRGHEGVIEVESRPGEGATVRLLLPLAEPQVKSPAARIDPEVELAATGTVLVVDDEPGVRFLARRVLEEFDFTVLTAVDGLDALKVVQSEGDQIDLVLLDLTMPNMDGEQAFEAIRELRPNMRVLLSSGYSRSETMERFADREIAGFVPKPYEIDELLGEVRRALADETSKALSGDSVGA